MILEDIEQLAASFISACFAYEGRDSMGLPTQSIATQLVI
jgi:hypothetical protein